MRYSSNNNDKNELEIRYAREFPIFYPESNTLNLEEQTKIQKAINDGGISLYQKTYINSTKLPTLLNTDKKGVQIVLNEAPDDDVKQLGNKDYLSTPQVQKEIAKRKEQPRSKLDREKLKYAGDCVEAFSSNPQLDTERTIESDRINNERPKLGQKVMKERNSTKSELSGEPLNGEGVVHHKNRVADKPEEALNRYNLEVIKKREHIDYHASDFTQNADGYDEYKKSLKFRNKN